MNELTPLQGAELAVRRAEHQPDYLALSLQTAQKLAESNAVQAVALTQLAAQQVTAKQGVSAGKVVAISGAVVVGGGVVVALIMSLALLAGVLGLFGTMGYGAYRQVMKDKGRI